MPFFPLNGSTFPNLQTAWSSREVASISAFHVQSMWQLQMVQQKYGMFSAAVTASRCWPGTDEKKCMTVIKLLAWKLRLYLLLWSMAGLPTSSSQAGPLSFVVNNSQFSLQFLQIFIKNEDEGDNV
jgi:hypothetical protein